MDRPVMQVLTAREVSATTIAVIRGRERCNDEMKWPAWGPADRWILVHHDYSNND